MSDIIELYIPPGRFTHGSLFEKRTVNSRGQPIEEAKQQFEVGIAIRKDSPEIQGFFGNLLQAATQAHAANPAAGPVIQNWFQTMDGFSMKVSDGDKPNAKGEFNENTKGCFVVWTSTGFATPCTDAQNVQIDPSTIKRGDYVDAMVTVKSNGNQIGDGIGIYVNLSLLRLQGVGEEIKSGPSVADLAARMPASIGALPPGAMPPGSAPLAQNPVPGMAAPTPHQPAAPVTPAVPGVGTAPQVPSGPPGMTTSPTEPHPGIMPPGTVPGM